LNAFLFGLIFEQVEFRDYLAQVEIEDESVLEKIADYKFAGNARLFATHKVKKGLFDFVLGKKHGDITFQTFKSSFHVEVFSHAILSQFGLNKMQERLEIFENDYKEKKNQRKLMSQSKPNPAAVHDLKVLYLKVLDVKSLDFKMQIIDETKTTVRKIQLPNKVFVDMFLDFRYGFNWNYDDNAGQPVDALYYQMKSMLQIVHKNILTMYGFAIIKDVPIILKEYFDGGREFQMVYQNIKDPDEKVEIAKGMLSVLALMHERGYLLRNISPSTIHYNAKTKQIKFVDLARLKPGKFSNMTVHTEIHSIHRSK
jgi:serine/threonine protein kinase